MKAVEMRCCATILTAAIVMVTGTAEAAPTSPSYDDWIKLRSFAAWSCRLAIIAPSCGFDLRQTADRFSEIKQSFALTDEQQRSLDDTAINCLEGKPAPIKNDIDPLICSKGKELTSDLLFKWWPSATEFPRPNDH